MIFENHIFGHNQSKVVATALATNTFGIFHTLLVIFKEFGTRAIYLYINRIIGNWSAFETDTLIIFIDR